MKNFASVFPLVDHPVMIEDGKVEKVTTPGLTLRQLYAGMHMMGKASYGDRVNPELAFEAADEMIQFEVDEMKKEGKDEK